MAGFSDLDPKNYITGATDDTNIGNEGDRLKVDAQISGGSPTFNGSKYNVEWSRTDITLVNTGTGTTIFQYTGAGMLESFLLEVEDKNTDILLFIDGVERYDIDLRVYDDMSFEHGQIGEYPVAYDKAEKIFKHYNRFPITFTTSFEIKARSNNKKIKSYVVNYFEA